MTRAEIIQAIKEAWVSALMDVKDIREDIADSYAAWVRGLIQAAAPELSGQAQMQAGQGQGGGGEAAAPAPNEGGM